MHLTLYDFTLLWFFAFDPTQFHIFCILPYIALILHFTLLNFTYFFAFDPTLILHFYDFLHFALLNFTYFCIWPYIDSTILLHLKISPLTISHFILQKMLCFSPSERITASEALLHPYFSEYGYEPLSFSPSSSSSRSMRTDSSFNSSILSFSSHDDSGASLGDISGSSAGCSTNPGPSTSTGQPWNYLVP